MGTNLSKKARQQILLSKKTGGTEINLQDCDIRKVTGFKLIVKLKLLVKLDLSKNYLTSLPSSVKKLVNLKEFYVGFNEIAELPPEICTLIHLELLDVEGNGISKLPGPNFGNLAGLRTLNIAGNKIQQLPSDFSNLRSLTSLNYGSNNLTSLPPQVFTLTNLKILIITGNTLDLPASLPKLSRLEELDISCNKIKVLSPIIGQMTSLTNLNISRNDLVAIPNELLKLSQLKVWQCEANFLTHMDNLTFDSLTSMEEMNFASNQLDRLPNGFGSMTRLRVLNLNNNTLPKLPKEIGWLGPSMRKLLVASNRLEALPGEFTFLNRAMEFDLSGNPLTSPFVQWYEESIVTLMDNLPPYLKAYPKLCTASGEEITKIVCGKPTQWTIQAKDKQGKNRINGGDVFVVNYRGKDQDGKDAEQKAIVKDNKDGTYAVFINFRIAGNFTVEIMESGQHIEGSPKPAVVVPGAPDPDRTELNASGLANATVGKPTSFLLTARDRFANRHQKGGCANAFVIKIIGPHGVNPKALVQDRDNGEYEIAFSPAWGGPYTISVQINNTDLHGSPIQINVAG